MDMIHLLEEELDNKAILDLQPIQLGDVKESFADIDLSIKELGFKPLINISQGIPLFVDWYKKYYY